MALDVEAAMVERRALEQAIEEAIRAFETTTGLEVVSFWVQRIQVCDGKPTSQLLGVRVYVSLGV